MFSNGYDIASSLENMELTDLLPDNPQRVISTKEYATLYILNRWA